MPDLQSAATTNTNGVAFNVLRDGAVSFQVSGTFSATVNFEGTVDQQTWVALSATNVATSAAATTATAAGIYVADCAGFVLVRARVSAYASGTVSVFAEAAAASRSRAVQTAASTTATVSASASVQTLFAANSARLGAKAYNESAAVLYIKLGAAASTTDYTEQVPASALWKLDDVSYTGIITGVWSSATGAARTTVW